MRTRPAFRTLLLGTLLVSAVLPLGLLVMRSVAGGWFYPELWPDHWSFAAWRLWGDHHGRLARSLFTSVGLGVVTTMLATLVGWPIGRALAQLRGWRRALGATIAFLPIAAPPVALGTGLYLLALQAGTVGTLTGVALGHLVPAAGYVAMYYFGVFSAFDHRIEAEARTLGARPGQVLSRVTLPMMRHQVGEALALGFLVSWAQLALTLVLGGGAVSTLPVEVFAAFQAGQDDLAAAGALLLAGPPVIALGVVGMALIRAEAVPL